MSLAELTELIARFQHLLGGFWILLWAAAWISGLAAVIIGVNAAARRADQGPGQGGWGGPAAWAGTGLLLLVLPVTLNSLSVSLVGGSGWREAGQGIFSTAPSLLSAFESQATRETIAGILRIIQFLGAAAVFRGILILNSAAQPAGRGTAGAGLTHVIGGALAVNIEPVLGALEKLVAA